MAHRDFLQLFVLFLCFSFIISSAAVPTSRSFKLVKDDSSVQDLLAKDVMDGKTDGEMLGEEFIEGRMDLVRTDYTGTGPNTHHDPRPPVKV